MNLPDVILAGVSKAGSTTIAEYLSSGKYINFIKKEIHFYDINYNRGIEWYKQHFTGISGEKTPSYFYHYGVPEKIKSTNPNVKLIFVFRDPIKRAYSHYWHMVRTGWEKRSFEEVVRDEIILNRDVNELRYMQLGIFSKSKVSGVPYLAIGFYDEHIKRWEKYFKRDNMFFMSIEALNEEALKKLCEFIEIPYYEIGKKRENRGSGPKYKLISGVLPLFYFNSELHHYIMGINAAPYPPIKNNVKLLLKDYYYKTYVAMKKYDLDVEKWI